MNIEKHLRQIKTNIKYEDYDHAKNLCNELLEIDSEHIEANYLLATIYVLTEKYDEAIELYTAIIDILPNDNIKPHKSSIYIARGFTFEKQFKYQSAIKDYTKANALAPQADLPLTLIYKALKRSFRLN